MSSICIRGHDTTFTGRDAQADASLQTGFPEGGLPREDRGGEDCGAKIDRAELLRERGAVDRRKEFEYRGAIKAGEAAVSRP
jgi:hypothetical protein